ncbi:MAG: GWxTD domain-containing protein [Ignavibacteria bacterium]|nr:GWxTD domain-containing protein [Ignavibacteria bacterium]
MNRLLFFTLSILVASSLYLQAYSSEEEDFFFDAIVFKGEDSARLDIFLAIPNQRLTFVTAGELYTAGFEVVVTISNVNDATKNISRKYSRKVSAKTYSEASGGNGEFTNITASEHLPVGTYKVRAVLNDLANSREYEKSRQISVIDFAQFPLVMSSIMLVSEIDEYEGNYTITPFISDNIGNLSEGYFCFFEVYNDGESRNMNIVTEIMDKESKVLYSDTVMKVVDSERTQLYVKIPAGIVYGSNENSIRIYLTAEDNYQILAAASRSIRCNSFLYNRIASNLPLAIRQLRYVATQSAIDSINAGVNEAERLSLFERFWNKLDPTPGTIRNEAMEEYFARIDYAEKSFKAYTEGWLTDKGEVYVVFGPPMNIERTNRSFADNRTYEQWTYSSNRQFIFVDVSGFGDFRLYSPSVVTDKYEYK